LEKKQGVWVTFFYSFFAKIGVFFGCLGHLFEAFLGVWVTFFGKISLFMGSAETNNIIIPHVVRADKVFAHLSFKKRNKTVY